MCEPVTRFERQNSSLPSLLNTFRLRFLAAASRCSSIAVDVTPDTAPAEVDPTGAWTESAFGSGRGAVLEQPTTTRPANKISPRIPASLSRTIPPRRLAQPSPCDH